MYCPRCGQQQASNDARFCSRCGFQLAATRELLFSDGVSVPPGVRAQQNTRSPRQKGRRLGGKLMFAALGIAPITFAFCLLVESPVPLLLPTIIFWVGLMRMLYARLFEDEAQFTAYKMYLPPMIEQNPPLLSPDYQPAADYGPRRVNTAEIAQPPSVTESTTKLLKEQRD